MDNALKSANINRYSHKTLLGNWHEDISNAERDKAELLDRIQQGNLQSLKIEEEIDQCLAHIDITYAKDGLIRYGDRVVVFNARTVGVLSIDPLDPVHTSKFMPEQYNVTSSNQIKGHVVRNTFIIESKNKSYEDGELLRYGDHFYLRSALPTNEALYLSSERLGLTSTSSRVGKLQPVYAIAEKSAECLWKLQWLDPDSRVLMEKEPVQANSTGLLLHVRTGQALAASERHQVINDFGKEYEVNCHTYVRSGKKKLISAEHSGTGTVDDLAKVELSENHWAFLTAKKK